MRDRRTQRDERERETNPLRALIEALAAQADRLTEHLERIADEAFIETADGRRRFRLRPGHRFGRPTERSRPGDQDDEDDP